MKKDTNEKTPLAEVPTQIVTRLPQYNNPAWRALFLAWETGEIDTNTYTQFCNDFGFLIF